MSKRTCSEVGCERPHECRGLCNMHYLRLRKSGTTADPLRLSETERFWALVNKDGPIPAHVPHLGPCWEWTGARDNKGYGRFGVNLGGNKWRTILAHRWAWEHLHGPVPPDKPCVLHACDNPRCIRHLFVGTLGDNNTDMRDKGRGSTPPVRQPQTHCAKGHPMSGDNLYVNPNSGRRECRTCQRTRWTARRR